MPFVQSLRVCVRVHAASLSGPRLINSEACSKLLSESDTTSTFTGTTKDWWPEKAPEKSYKHLNMLQKNLLTSIFASVAPLRPSHASYGCTLHPHMQYGFHMHTLHAQFSDQSRRHGNDRSHARRPRVHGDESTDELDQHPCCLDLNQCLCEHTARRARTGLISIRAAWTSICERAHIPIHDEHGGQRRRLRAPAVARMAAPTEEDKIWVRCWRI